jgi:phage-related protein
MELIFSDSAKKELENLPQDLKAVFRKHMEKNVTKQARIIYNVKGDQTYILHCFKSHKEYERWYKSYK